MTQTTTTIPGYLTGRWTIDPVHSEIGFAVRHMMVSKVRGRFTSFEGEIVTGEDPLDSSVQASIALSSVDTGNEDRDGHLRSADFFGTDANDTMTYRSTSVRRDGHDLIVDGELTLKGVTKSVPLHLEIGGFGPDAFGGTRAGFTATGSISRSEFGVEFNGVMETGGVIVGDTVELRLEVEGVLAS
ncbi:MAG TPA: YceI family protein [Acidimicrobiia bacterium]|nr:YceI family protein [Acidimicrobiia bacterium]